LPIIYIFTYVFIYIEGIDIFDFFYFQFLLILQKTLKNIILYIYKITKKIILQKIIILKMINTKLLLLWSWGIINLITGFWEIYVFINRNSLELENKTIWDKISENKINLSNFWIEGFSEYSKVDSRYIIKPYVWTFELINALISILFIILLIIQKYELLNLVLVATIINCILYFATLFMEIYIIKDENIINNIKQYAKKWMLPIYYLISSIWIFIPMILLVY